MRRTAAVALLAALPALAGGSPTLPVGSSHADAAPFAASLWSAESLVSGPSEEASLAVGRKLAVDGSGRVHAAWSDSSSGVARVHAAFSDDGGATWSLPTELARSGRPANGASLAASAAGLVVVTFADRREGGPQRIFWVRSTDGGESWSAPRDLSGPSALDAAPASVSIDRRGRVHAAWHTGSTDRATPFAEVLYARSTDEGLSFGAPRRLGGGAGHAAFPRFTASESDDLLVIPWRDHRRTPDIDVYAAVSTDGGETFAERLVLATPMRELDPDAAVTPDGTIHVGVMTNRGDTVAVDHLRSTDLGKSWSAPQTLSSHRGRFPFLVPDPARGALWAFWKDERDAGTPACPADWCADVAARRSRDGGLTWDAPELATDLGTVEVKLPSPAVAPDGVPLVIWSDARDGVERVRLVRRLAP